MCAKAIFEVAHSFQILFPFCAVSGMSFVWFLTSPGRLWDRVLKPHIQRDAINRWRFSLLQELLVIKRMCHRVCPLPSHFTVSWRWKRRADIYEYHKRLPFEKVSIFWAHSHQYLQRLLVISRPLKWFPCSRMVRSVFMNTPPPTTTCWRDRAPTSHPPAPSLKPVLRLACAWRAWWMMEYASNFSLYKEQYERTVEAERARVCAAVGRGARKVAYASVYVRAMAWHLFFSSFCVFISFFLLSFAYNHNKKTLTHCPSSNRN